MLRTSRKHYSQLNLFCCCFERLVKCVLKVFWNTLRKYYFVTLLRHFCSFGYSPESKPIELGQLSNLAAINTSTSSKTCPRRTKPFLSKAITMY